MNLFETNPKVVVQSLEEAATKIDQLVASQQRLRIRCRMTVEKEGRGTSYMLYNSSAFSSDIAPREMKSSTLLLSDGTGCGVLAWLLRTFLSRVTS